MNEWFFVTVKYHKVNEAGKTVAASEHYLVDALSFTEAEARIVEEMKPFISGDFTVSAVKRARIAELLPDDAPEADRWWRCRLAFTTLNEKTGLEKRTFSTMLVQAASLDGALASLRHGMNLLADYEVTAIAETAIMDVYPYGPGGK